MIDVCLILATLNFKLGTNQAEDTESSLLVSCSFSLKSTLLMFVTPNFDLVLRNSYECLLVGLSVTKEIIFCKMRTW